MGDYHYTSERSHQILIALLKAHGIKKVVTSPGATNISLVASMQQDSYFEMYSSVDERSAAYMACGMAEESGEPVVLSCTGATASRNYLPGLTEAYYRKLPILAITSNQGKYNIGHLIAQNLDRANVPVDAALMSVDIQNIMSEKDEWYSQLNMNKAILELKHRGGGPVHINLATTFSPVYNVKDLPEVNVIHRYFRDDDFPEMPEGRIAVFVGSHRDFTEAETLAVDKFCSRHNAMVFCDHTSGYKGKYRIMYALVGGQEHCPSEFLQVELLIHIGEVSGDYYSLNLRPHEVWRVNPDGQLRDTFMKLTKVFEMDEADFFLKYSSEDGVSDDSVYVDCRNRYRQLYDEIPDLPFSNIWIAKTVSGELPRNSNVHFGILNTLRSWDFFEVANDIHTSCNVGAFGIDGCMSSLIGAALVSPERVNIGIFGDLAFFYDLNSLGNRHITSNVRIMLINNGCGTEFKNYSHMGAILGEDVGDYVAAEGHFGKKSPCLVRHFSTDLGFEYKCAGNKEEFLAVIDWFLNPEVTEKPLMLEVFTDSNDESEALHTIRNILPDSRPIKRKVKDRIVHAISTSIGEEKKNALRTILGK